MLHRQALKKMLELKLPTVKVVHDSETEDIVIGQTRRVC